MGERKQKISRPNRGYRAFGIEWAPFILPIERRLETIAAFLWISSFFIGGIGTPVFFLYLFLYTRFYFVPIIYLSWMAWEWNTPRKGGRRSEWVRRWGLYKSLANYFPIKLVKTAELSPDRNYIVGCHPHGVLCASHFVNWGTEGTNISEVFPGIMPVLFSLNMFFCFPVFRDALMALGMRSVTRESINDVLESKKSGVAAAIVIGGTAEALDAHGENATIVLKNRKGFVKLALRNGASLVPVFSFGENSLYKQLDNPRGSFVRKFQDTMRSIMGLPPLLFYGRGVFQYSFGIVPYRKEVVSVVGAPIDVPKIENPTNEDVTKYHNLYMEGLNDIYEKYKHQYAENPKGHINFV